MVIPPKCFAFVSLPVSLTKARCCDWGFPSCQYCQTELVVFAHVAQAIMGIDAEVVVRIGGIQSHRMAEIQLSPLPSYAMLFFGFFVATVIINMKVLARRTQ